MTIRLSQSSLTGTERTEVAVGTESEASMFCTVRAGAPRRTVYVGSSLAAGGAGGRDSFGTGFEVPLAGSAALVCGRGLATGAGVGVGSLCSTCFGSGALVGVGAEDDVEVEVEAEAGAGFAAGAACDVPLDGAAPGLPLPWKYFTHVGSTLPGSRWYWSYISSTSHSLAPKSAPSKWLGTADLLPGDCGTV